MSGDARARKTDSVAAKMGDMLLKGYKMLAVSCEICNNVLLQDKQGNTICVSCTTSEQDRSARMLTSPLLSADIKPTGSGSTKPEDMDIGEAIDILNHEIITASRQLGATNNCSAKMDIVSYIHKCAETVNLLNK